MSNSFSQIRPDVHFVSSDLINQTLPALYLPVLSADAFANSLDPDQAQQDWIHTIWHSDGIPEFIFKKSWWQKSMQFTQLEKSW